MNPSKHPRAYLISVSVVMFGLQALFVRAFHLFFTQLDAQALIPWSFLGILLSCILLSVNHVKLIKQINRFLDLRFVCLVMLAYGASCFYIIHFIPALITVVLVNLGLGMCLARTAMSLEAYRFYFLDFFGGIAGCLLAFFLPQYLNLEVTYVLLITIAALSATFAERTAKVSSVWLGLSGVFVVATLVLSLHPLWDLTVYGATFQKPDDYAHSPSRHGQIMLQSGAGQRVFSGWSSVGKVEVHASAAERGTKYDFFLNNINYFSLTPDQPKIAGTYGKNKRALVLGAGGGWEMRFLRDQGYQDLTGVEINEVLYDLVNRRFTNEGENIFAQSRSVLGEGRNFVETDKTKYDLIVIRYLGNAGGLIGSSDDLSENYLYTTEAFQSYYDHLKPGGLLMTGTSYSKDPAPNPALLRTSQTLIEILRKAGGDPAQQMWVIGQERKKYSLPERRFRALLFMRKGPLQDENLLRQEERFITDMTQGLEVNEPYLVLHPTNLKNPQMSSTALYNKQEEFLRRAMQADITSEIKSVYDLDISPTPDERPYFYQFDATPSFPLKPAGFLFWMCAVLLAAMVFFLSRPSIQHASQGRRLLWLGGALGFAYGILEIALLNAFTIAFSSITWNFSLLIFGLLSGSALAGAIGGKMTDRPTKVFISISALALLALFFFDFKSHILIYESQVYRSLILIAVTLLISFGASLSYPLLLKNSEGLDPRMPAFILGINSGFFIMGSIVCRYLALELSLRHAFFLAGLIYVGVVFAIPSAATRKMASNSGSKSPKF